MASAVAAVTSEALCDCPPAARTTAVCEVPPPAGIEPSSAPPRLAAPLATSSRFASIGGSDERANARPAAMLSVKLMSAIPRAPGTSRPIRERSGIVSGGKPACITPTVETPRACRPKYHDAAMAPATATSGAGECGRSRSRPIKIAKVAAATRQRDQRRVGKMLHDREQIAEETRLGDVDAQELRHLVEDDHEADARLEAGQHRAWR